MTKVNPGQVDYPPFSQHVDNMQSAIGKLEMETGQQQENSAALTKHLEALKKMIVAR
jgi:hypothetical protein